MIQAPPEAGAFDVWDPANISPLVAYLASADCAFNGETFFVQGGAVRVVKSWEFGEGVERNERWTVDALGAALGAPRSRTGVASAQRRGSVAQTDDSSLERVFGSTKPLSTRMRAESNRWMVCASTLTCQCEHMSTV